MKSLRESVQRSIIESSQECLEIFRKIDENPYGIGANNSSIYVSTVSNEKTLDIDFQEKYKESSIKEKLISMGVPKSAISRVKDQGRAFRDRYRISVFEW